MNGFVLGPTLIVFALVGSPELRAQDTSDQPTPPAATEPVVASLEVVGNRRYRAEQLIATLGQEVGAPIDEDAIARGIRRLFDAYRVRATVRYAIALDEAGVEDPSRLELLLEVEEQPLDLEPRFLGNDSVDESELREWARLFVGSELFLYQAPRMRERILRGYRGKGFAFAEVEVVERPGGTDPETGLEVPPDVIFKIIEGPRVRVSDVVVTGNDAMPDVGWGFFRDGIQKLSGMELRGPRFFGLLKRSFDRDVLEADLVAMRNVYRDRGYLNVVVELALLEFNSERDRVKIHIAVDEGPQYRVGSLRIDAVERRGTNERGLPDFESVELLFDETKLTELLELGPGEVYEVATLRADARSIGSYYGSRGYLDHPSLGDERFQFLEPEVVYHEDEPVVDVVYRIQQGRQQTLREIRIRGNRFTRDRVIRDRIDLDPGDVADLDRIRRARNRIEGTGFFSDPFNVVEHRPPTFDFIDTGVPGVKDLVYTVEEGGGVNFGINGGITSTGGAFGSINLTKENFDIGRPPSSLFSTLDEFTSHEAFHGAGQTLRLQLQPGTRFSTYEMMFFEPDLFRRHRRAISLRLSARKRFRGFSSHDEERDELSARVGYRLGPDSSLFLGFTYGDVDVSDLSEGGEPSLSDPLSVPATLKDQEGRNNLGHLDFGYSYNTVDNRLSPRNGVNFSWNHQLFHAATGSDYEFLSTDVIFDFYDEFGIEDGSASNRWRFGARLGSAFALGDDDFVPYTERYFLGGRVMRGFDFRGVGPFEKGEPLGGETYLYTTLEYRHPLTTTTQPGTYREIETLHGGFFIDTSILDPDEFSLDPDQLRVSVGVLFGISVPLPITFSFGWPLVSEDDDDTQVLDFNIGF
ncbi:MAG: BamA/TamA family outer membrane protein [Planctomycetota bacterium]